MAANVTKHPVEALDAPEVDMGGMVKPSGMPAGGRVTLSGSRVGATESKSLEPVVGAIVSIPSIMPSAVGDAVGVPVPIRTPLSPAVGAAVGATVVMSTAVGATENSIARDKVGAGVPRIGLMGAAIGASV